MSLIFATQLTAVATGILAVFAKTGNAHLYDRVLAKAGPRLQPAQRSPA